MSFQSFDVEVMILFMKSSFDFINIKKTFVGLSSKYRKDESGLGFVESLVALMVAGIACAALLSVATSVIRDAKKNEIRDARNQYSAEGLDRLRWIAEQDQDQIPSPRTERYFCIGSAGECNSDGDELIEIDSNDLCSKGGDICEKLKLSGGGDDYFYREIDIKCGGCNSVRATVRVGPLSKTSTGVSSSAVKGYIGGLQNECTDACPVTEVCVDGGSPATTQWNENAFNCLGADKRCYEGECVQCGGVVLYSDGCGGCTGQGTQACWYLASNPNESCITVCGVAGCSTNKYWNADSGLFSAAGLNCYIKASLSKTYAPAVTRSGPRWFCYTRGSGGYGVQTCSAKASPYRRLCVCNY